MKVTDESVEGKEEEKEQEEGSRRIKMAVGGG